MTEWPSGGSNLAINAEIDEHPERYGGIWASHPLGGAWYPNGEGTVSELDVLTISVVGDLDEARTRLTALYEGPLCLTAARHSRAELLAVKAELADVVPDILIHAGLDEVEDRLVVEVKRVTPDSVPLLVRFGDRIDVRPVVRPAGARNNG